MVNLSKKEKTILLAQMKTYLDMIMYRVNHGQYDLIDECVTRIEEIRVKLGGTYND